MTTRPTDLFEGNDGGHAFNYARLGREGWDSSRFAVYDRDGYRWTAFRAPLPEYDAVQHLGAGRAHVLVALFGPHSQSGTAYLLQRDAYLAPDYVGEKFGVPERFEDAATQAIRMVLGHEDEL